MKLLSAFSFLDFALHFLFTRAFPVGGNGNKKIRCIQILLVVESSTRAFPVGGNGNFLRRILETYWITVSTRAFPVGGNGNETFAPCNKCCQCGLHVLSRSEGMETWIVVFAHNRSGTVVYTCFPGRREWKPLTSASTKLSLLCLHVPSRSEGMETYRTKVNLVIPLNGSTRAFPVGGNGNMCTHVCTHRYWKVYTCLPVRREWKLFPRSLTTAHRDAPTPCKRKAPHTHFGRRFPLCCFGNHFLIFAFYKWAHLYIRKCDTVQM